MVGAIQGGFSQLWEDTEKRSLERRVRKGKVGEDTGRSTGRDGPRIERVLFCIYKERLALFLFAWSCPGS